MNKDIDREWYDNDEMGMAEDDYNLERKFVGDSDVFEAMEKQLELRNERMADKQTLRQREKSEEQNKWELNRMVTSGIFKINNIRFDREEDDDKRVVLMVHDIKPPFLMGRDVRTTQNGPVQIVRDPTSDLAIISKKGSAVLASLRERNDRNKMRERFWELAGSRLGQLLGVEKREDDPDNATFDEDGNLDYKKSSQYATALNKKQEGSSDFSRKKTLQEQREYLPVYSIRDEMVQLINDNKVVIIVGETGSGKTTQLTQYLVTIFPS